VKKNDLIPLTPFGYESLKSQIKHLRFVERPQVIAELSSARALGDLKENAEYHAAKERQAHLDGKLQNLETQLARAHVMQLPKNDLKKVVFGVVVVLEDLDEEDESKVYKFYHLVGDFEANLKENKISITSPLGRALINKKVDDDVLLQLPKGEREYRVLSIHESQEKAKKALENLQSQS
jgi:transcription elongation factor GreA